MGLGPRQVDDLSLWEFGTIWRGWRRANSTEPEIRYPTAEQHDAAVAFAVAHSRA